MLHICLKGIPVLMLCLLESRSLYAYSVNNVILNSETENGTDDSDLLGVITENPSGTTEVYATNLVDVVLTVVETPSILQAQSSSPDRAPGMVMDKDVELALGIVGIFLFLMLASWIIMVFSKTFRQRILENSADNVESKHKTTHWEYMKQKTMSIFPTAKK